MDPFEPAAYELPEEAIKADPESSGNEIAIKTTKLMHYLKNGGLVAILRSNTSGGKNQPKVWLRLDSLGNVTHTFIKERGKSAANVPFSAVHEDHVFTPKRNEVLALLRSFGLDNAHAEEVITSVGTSPM